MPTMSHGSDASPAVQKMSTMPTRQSVRDERQTGYRKRVSVAQQDGHRTDVEDDEPRGEHDAAFGKSLNDGVGWRNEPTVHSPDMRVRVVVDTDTDYW